MAFREPSPIRRDLAAHFQKGSGEPTVTYAEALDEALCHGWIDGLKQSHDELSWRQRFTPRRPKSGWSKINTRHAERLIKAGRMKAAGQAQIDAAKKDGRWAAAYDSSSQATFPEDFLSRQSAGTKKRTRSSSRSARPIATQSPTACKPQRSQKPGSAAWKRFLQCCAEAKPSTS